MINKQPRKMILTELKGGYDKIYVTNSTPQDADILGRAFWVNESGSNDPATLIKLDALTQFATLKNLKPNTSYTVRGAFYDAMVDDELLIAQALIDLSDVSMVATRSGPVILGIGSEKVDVDIGVALPNITFNLEGASDTLVIEYQERGKSDWVEFYSGASVSKLALPAPKVGAFKFRCKGIIYTNNGSISETSPYFDYPGWVNVGFNLTNPAAPKNVKVLVGKINDTFERYDVQVTWDWAKGSGAGLKSFVVSYTSEQDYDVNNWDNAKTMSVGNATAAIIPNFPYNIPHKIKVTAYSYGSPPNNEAASPVKELLIDENTKLDTTFTKSTLVDVSYNGIFGYRQYGSARIPTFAIDAASGNVGLGTPVNNVFPIQLNGTDGTLSVDGGIITKQINAASFVLTNFTGKDNPALYSEGKVYGSGRPGIWTGYDNVTGNYKLDIGNNAKFIRWDGNDLLISGQVKIGTPLGGINLENLVGKSVVWVYKKGVNRPAQPTGDIYPPAGWSKTPVAITNPSELMWTCQGILNEITGKLYPGEAWGNVFQFSGSAGTAGSQGRSTYKSTVFIRSNTKPTTPTGGSYNDPIPSGWFDGIPNGTTILWSSTRVLTSDGSSPQEATWSAPAQMTDTSTQEIRYSERASSPGSPTSNPPYWKTTANANTIWMAVRVSYNGVWNAWQVSKIKGEKGADGKNGKPGVPGTPGKDGKVTYTWIKYANSASGSGISDSPVGKTYIGFAYNKDTPTESNTPSNYTWSLIKGTDGVPGAKGKDGKTLYTWIKYSDNANGNPAYDQPKASTVYIGIAVNKTTATESGDYRQYVWSRFKGATGSRGPQGVPGGKGADGRIFYTWIRYADTASGGGISNSPTNKEYVGFAYNKTSASESNNPRDYTWSLIKGKDGAKGDRGVPGGKGADGKTLYTWIRYSDRSNGNPNYDVPRASTKYIGIAVNKTTAAESSSYNQYVWSLFKGADGSNGRNGTNGKDGKPGLPGANGARGAGFYVIATSNGAWSNGVANSATPGGRPVKDDVVTIFKQSNTKVSSTRRFNGSTWVSPGLVVHGDMIATGTIAGDRFVANTSISAPRIIGGQIAIGGSAGTFNVSTAGAVSIKSGTSGARMEIKNDQILVYNDAGKLVVKIGRL